MSLLFVSYPKCTTCQRAKAWLEARGVPFEERHIKEQNPTAEELREWQRRGGLPVKAFFNTCGQLYRQMELKDKLPGMSEEEQLALLATDGMLVKRFVLAGDDFAATGFKESQWAERV